MQFFALLCLAAAVVAAFCLLLAALLFVLGLCWRRPALKVAAIVPLAAAGLASVPLLLLLAPDDSHPPEAIVRRRIVGTYRGRGADFEETIIVSGGPASFTFRHRLEREGRLEGDEAGAATVEGSEIRFDRFTEWVESKTGSLEDNPKEFISYPYVFVAGPPFDLLQPFDEHDYALRKVD